MKKPKYISGILATVFLWLGVAFIITGALCFFGIMKPSPHSVVQDNIVMGHIFNWTGFALCMTQVVLRIIDYKRVKSIESVLSQGVIAIAEVNRIRHIKSVKFNRKSPYRIYYSYVYRGEPYHGKTPLLWEKPNIKVGDRIEILVGETGISACPDKIE